MFINIVMILVSLVTSLIVYVQHEPGDELVVAVHAGGHVAVAAGPGAISTADTARQTVELLDNLVALLAGLVHVNGHARESCILARSHIERMDIVTAAGEQTGHARKHAKLVLYQYRDCV